ncbi:MAG: ABC transporter substrate-binding protein [Mobilitalea sp.]
MKKLTGLLLVILLFVIILSGCSGNTGKDSGSDTAVITQSPSETAEVEEEAVVQEEQDLEDTEVEESAWPRTYVDSLGHEVTLEKQPERIISVFHAMYPDYLYALGSYPLGAAMADNLLNQWAAYKNFTTVNAAVDIGAPASPNLEKILELEPDLIIGAALNADIYDDLAKIAPTVILDYASINKDRVYGLEQFAILLGKEDKVAEVVADIENSIQSGVEQLQDFKAKEESVIFISITDKDIWPYTTAQLNVIYSEEDGLGLLAPEGYAEVTDGSTALSLEAMAEYNPDHIFLMTDYGDDTAKQWVEELTSNSVWSSITAVQEGNIYFTDRSIFAFNSPIATQYGIGFVVESLTE